VNGGNIEWDGIDFEQDSHHFHNGTTFIEWEA
jgi:hypothetical protein